MKKKPFLMLLVLFISVLVLGCTEKSSSIFPAEYDSYYIGEAAIAFSYGEMDSCQINLHKDDEEGVVLSYSYGEFTKSTHETDTVILGMSMPVFNSLMAKIETYMQDVHGSSAYYIGMFSIAPDLDVGALPASYAVYSLTGGKIITDETIQRADLIGSASVISTDINAMLHIMLCK